MRYSFAVRKPRCEDWFEGVARPYDGGPERTSRRFASYAGAVGAVRYFIANGRFQSEEEDEEIEEIAVCEACGQTLPETKPAGS